MKASERRKSFKKTPRILFSLISSGIDLPRIDNLFFKFRQVDLDTTFLGS